MAHRLINEEALEMRQRFLDPDTEAMLNSDWVRMDAQMSRARATKAQWPYDFPVPEIGRSVSVGGRMATVVDFGIVRVSDTFERAVWVRFSGGTFSKVSGKELVIMSDEEKKELEKERAEMKKRLIESSKKIEQMQTEKKSSSRQMHLNSKFIAMATSMGLTIDEKSGFHKVVGSKKNRAIYISKSGGRVDVSGFQVDDRNISKISETEAKAKHLGRVRGQFIFGASEDELMVSFKKACEELV